MLEVAAGIGGTLLVLLMLSDVFQAVIVPRAVGGRWRPSALISRYGWRLLRDRALVLRNAERREDTLGLFAPAILVVYLMVWVNGLVLGFGLLFWAFRFAVRPEPSLGDAIYFAGTSLLTIGYGDFTPAQWFTRFLALSAAASGLAVLAITTTFLFQTFAAFQRREAYVAAVSERFGAPPSGVELLAAHARLGLATEDLRPLLREGQHWIAEVMESHLAYPILTYFRSAHDDESWVGTLGALLDVSTLLTTTAELGAAGEATITLRLGRHLVRDFTAYFRLPEHDAAGVEFQEFAEAHRVLVEAGIPCRAVEDAWPEFSRIRASYSAPLDAMARWWRIPPARWIGDRSRIRAHVNAGISA